MGTFISLDTAENYAEICGYLNPNYLIQKKRKPVT